MSSNPENVERELLMAMANCICLLMKNTGRTDITPYHEAARDLRLAVYKMQEGVTNDRR